MLSNNKGSIIRNIVGVTISNISTIVAGIVAGFLLPKILPVEDYGWYKTFTLYMTYIGFFSLGMIDGIVLKYGGFNYDEIDRLAFRSFFKWYILVHFFFACLINLISISLSDTNLRLILILISVNMIAVNITGYFQQISQITQRFKEYSLRKIIQSILNIFVVGMIYGIFLIYGRTNYLQYLVLFVLANVGLAVWYLYTYRDIVYGDASSLSSTKNEVIRLCKNGFPLLFANLCSTLILTLDRQFVNLLFDTLVYAKYAFAYNMLALVTVATSAMSTVLYPTLKRTKKEMMRSNFSFLISLVLIVVFGALAVYFPLCMFVKWFLPKYTDSLVIFRIVFPGLALSSPITVIMHNFYKAEGKNLLYFRKSLVVLVVSAIANEIAYVVFHSTQAISIASIITMAFWYVLVEHYFYKEYSGTSLRNVIFIMIMMLVFYLITTISNYYIGFVIYVLSFAVIVFAMFRQNYFQIIKLLQK